MSLDKELQRDRKTARRSFSASLMSNTKWRSLLAAIDGARIDVGAPGREISSTSTKRRR